MHSSATASTGHRSALRLTRRGRVVVLLGLVSLLLLAFSLGRVGSQAAPRPTHRAAPLAQTVVHEGETLWGLAQRVAPGHDPREVVAAIEELNDLQTDELQPGQLLLLPA